MLSAGQQFLERVIALLHFVYMDIQCPPDQKELKETPH